MLRWVLIRDPQAEFKAQALLSTQLSHSPAQILAWFVRRWTMEVTLEETRAHLGIETQRQWSDLAIGRTTPALFGLYSLVTLLAHSLPPAQTRLVRTAAWYAKPRQPSQTPWRWSYGGCGVITIFPGRRPNPRW